MHTKITKKLLGTLALVAALGAVAALNAGEVFARFIDTSSRVISDVTVLDIDGDSLLVEAEGTDPFEVGINNRTVFSPNLGAITPGDIVDINATARGGELVARTVRAADSAYGDVGDTVVIRTGEVVSVGPDTLTVDTGNVVVTFDITPSTRFIRTNLTFLEPGDTVRITGQEGVDSFQARTVILSR